MLVLGRRLNERIVIEGGRIVVTVVDIGDGRVRLGITAPDGVRVDREEIHLVRVAEGGGSDAQS